MQKSVQQKMTKICGMLFVLLVCTMMMWVYFTVEKHPHQTKNNGEAQAAQKKGVQKN